MIIGFGKKAKVRGGSLTFPINPALSEGATPRGKNWAEPSGSLLCPGGKLGFSPLGSSSYLFPKPSRTAELWAQNLQGGQPTREPPCPLPPTAWTWGSGDLSPHGTCYGIA